ncbi:MAG: hypothetical protein KDJ52_09590 [Anaerolineae bacterium]|nr:hypothetical protein [Anaerolineae bacterium]
MKEAAKINPFYNTLCPVPPTIRRFLVIPLPLLLLVPLDMMSAERVREAAYQLKMHSRQKQVAETPGALEKLKAAQVEFQAHIEIHCLCHELQPVTAFYTQG